MKSLFIVAVQILTLFVVVECQENVALKKIDAPSEEFEIGWISKDKFITDILPENSTQIMNDQVWFVYLFHSYCKTKRCLKINDAYA